MADDPNKRENQGTGSSQSSQQHKDNPSDRFPNPSQRNEQGGESNVPRKNPAQGGRDVESEEGQKREQGDQKKAS